MPDVITLRERLIIALRLTLGDLRFPLAFFNSDLIKQPLDKQCDLRAAVVSLIADAMVVMQRRGRNSQRLHQLHCVKIARYNIFNR
jgi:hypothetical protein